MTSKPEDHNNQTTIKIKDKQFSRFALLPINLMALYIQLHTSFLDYTTVALALVQLLSSSTS